jgi:hypothetical protein
MEPIEFFQYFASLLHAKDITIKYNFVTNDMKSFLLTRISSSYRGYCIDITMKNNDEGKGLLYQNWISSIEPSE